MATSTSDIAVDAIIDEIGEQIDTGISVEHPQEVAPRLSTDTSQKVDVWSMVDGEKRQILRIDAPRVLKKLLEGGGRAFWAEGMPGGPPEVTQGNVQCMLHPDFDESDGPAGFDRSYIDSIGLTGRTCNMMSPGKGNVSNLKSVYDRDDHMTKKHPREWRTIEAALEKASQSLEVAERKEDREAMLALAGTAAVAPRTEAKPKEEVVQFICDIGICDFDSDTDVGLARHKRMARDEAHRQARGEAI